MRARPGTASQTVGPRRHSIASAGARPGSSQGPERPAPGVLVQSMDFDDFTHRDWTTASVSAKRRNSSLARRRRSVAATAVANNPLADVVVAKPPVVPPRMLRHMLLWTPEQRARALVLTNKLAGVWRDHWLRPSWRVWHDALTAERTKFARMRKEDVKLMATEVVYTTTPGLRSSDQLGSLIHWVRSLGANALPADMERPHLLDLCQHAEHRHLTAGEILFVQGEPGDAFYIVYEGCVGLFAVNDQAVANRRLRAWKAAPEREQELSRERPKHFGEHVFSVVKGRGFGEVSLFTAEGVRTTTALATEATDMLVVPRELYQRCLRRYHVPAFQLTAKLRYLRALTFFTDWNEQHLVRLAYAMQRRSFPRHAVLVHQGSALTHVFFTVSGECKVSVRAEMTSAAEKSKRAELEGIANVRTHHAPTRIVEVAIMGPNQIIGEMSLLSGKSSASASVIANSEVEVYALPVSAFIKYVIKGSAGTNTVQALQENVRERRVLRQQRIARERQMAQRAEGASVMASLRGESGMVADKPSKLGGYKPVSMAMPRTTPKYFARPQTAPSLRSTGRVLEATLDEAGAHAAMSMSGSGVPPRPRPQQQQPPMEISRERRFEGDVYSVRQQPKSEHLTYPLNPYQLRSARSGPPTVQVTEEEVLTKVLLGQDRPKSACTITALERRAKANKNRPRSAAFLSPAEEARIDRKKREAPEHFGRLRLRAAKLSGVRRRIGEDPTQPAAADDDDDDDGHTVGEPPPTKLRIKRFAAKPEMVRPMVCTPGLLAVEEREAAVDAAEEAILGSHPTLEEAMTAEADAALAEARAKFDEDFAVPPPQIRLRPASASASASPSRAGSRVASRAGSRRSSRAGSRPGSRRPSRGDGDEAEVRRRLDEASASVGQAALLGTEDEQPPGVDEEGSALSAAASASADEEHSSIQSLFQNSHRDVVEEQSDMLAKHYEVVEKLLRRTERLLYKKPERTELDRVKTVVKATVLAKKKVHLGEAARARGRVQHRGAL